MTYQEPDDDKERPKPFVTKEGFFEFVKQYKWDSVAYLILFAGLITLMFHHIIGGLIVGVVVGIYYSSQVKLRFDWLKEFLESHGIFRSFIVLAGILALLITSFGLVVGTLIGVYLRPIFGDAIHSPFEEDNM